MNGKKAKMLRRQSRECGQSSQKAELDGVKGGHRFEWRGARRVYRAMKNLYKALPEG